jgi:hypothetical protein
MNQQTIHMPKKKSKPATQFNQFRYLIFGQKKIGKTTMFGQMPNALFLPTEEGVKDLAVYQSVDKDDRPILLDTWPLFKAWVQGFIQSKKFDATIIDTIDGAYDLCEDWVCSELSIENPRDEAWGGAYTMIYRQFKNCFRPLMTCGKGVVLLSHDKTREVERWDSDKPINQLQCSIGGKCGNYITGAVDLWGYYGYYKDSRRLYIKGNQYLDCGSRFNHHFLTPKGKKLPYIPMGDSPEESYTNLLLGFDNKLGKQKKGKK